ncbi:MAG: hypothetical protein M0Z48_10865 [Nitrospiraceae bacterium]|nr:hypothetical protein [Nitrospiraceae bacterium]
MRKAIGVMAHYKLASERFIEYFKARGALIEKVENLTFRKILFATALDSLARAAFGNIQHRKRIVQLVDNLTDWNAKELVSLPQLELNLREKKLGRYRLYREVRRRLAQWSPGDIIPLARSPYATDLMKFADQQESTIVGNCRYPELFYTYRNNLIHEFREPGYGIEIPSDEDKPYYTYMINGPWQLVFPIGFFSAIFDQAVSGLHNYLTESKIDPYTRFEFGSLWRAN